MNATHEVTRSTGSFFEVLAATGDLNTDAPEDDLYGFLIGDWALDITAYSDEGEVIRSTGEAHAARVLEGRAVQDVFINPDRSSRTPDSRKFGN
jgi:hypothetical protein